MKKAIIGMIMVLMCCVSASAASVQKGYVYDASQDNLPYQWARISTEDGYTLIVDRNQYNIDVDDSLYVCIDNNNIVSIEKSNQNFVNDCKVKEQYVIDNTNWYEVLCHVSYINGKIKLTSMYGRDVWYTDSCDWIDYVPDVTNTVIVYADKQTGKMLAGIVWDV